LKSATSNCASMATVQELLSMGERLGLKGTELASFIEEQQTLAREERQRDREREKELRQEKRRINSMTWRS